MSKSKDLIKRHTESVTHNTLGNIITLGLAWGGAAVISALATYSGFLSGLPLYLLIFWGAIIFLILAAALNFIHLFVVRRRRLRAAAIDEPQQIATEPSGGEQLQPDANVKKLHDGITELEGEKTSLEERIETLNSQHQSEKTELQKQSEGLSREIDRLQKEVTTQGMMVSFRENQLESLRAESEEYKAQYKWLHEIAEAQEIGISHYVILQRVVMIIQPLTPPIINFYFDIRNDSNYYITIDVPAGQYIKFENEPLSYPITILDSKATECPPLKVMSLNIKQPLRIEEAEHIAEFGDRACYYFSLDDFNIFIKGGEHFTQVVTPQRLVMSAKPEFPALNVKKLTDRIKELERGKVAIEKEKSETVGQLGSELASVKNQYGWLHEMANAQARDIDRYVIVERVLLCGKRFEVDPPYIEFWLDIYNMSVFDLTLHKDVIGGRVIYRGERLLEGKEIVYDQDTIPSSKRRHLNVRQYLTQGQAESIAKYTDEVLEILLNFQEVDITVSGGTQFPQVGQKRLTMPQSIGTQYMAQLLKPSHDESADEEVVNASPNSR
jgi:hypothetical protein